jgi:hypothetical protein
MAHIRRGAVDHHIALRGSAVKVNYARALGVLVAVALVVFGVPATAGAQERDCEVRLTVEVSPAVPNASDDGFLSSLLNRYFDYRLALRREVALSVVELDLRGPGPEYRCQKVIEMMRKDARVQSIHIEPTRTLASLG